MPTHPSPLRAPLPPRHDGCVRRAFLAVLAASSTFALAQAPTTAPPSSAVEKAPDSATFANLAGSFRVQVPPSWRQLAPGELKALTAAELSTIFAGGNDGRAGKTGSAKSKYL